MSIYVILLDTVSAEILEMTYKHNDLEHICHICLSP